MKRSLSTRLTSPLLFVVITAVLFESVVELGQPASLAGSSALVSVTDEIY